MIFKTLWTIMWIAIWEIFKKSTWFTIDIDIRGQRFLNQLYFFFHFSLTFPLTAHFYSIIISTFIYLHLPDTFIQSIFYVFFLGIEPMTLGQFNINIKHKPFSITVWGFLPLWEWTRRTLNNSFYMIIQVLGLGICHHVFRHAIIAFWSTSVCKYHGKYHSAIW